MAAEKPGMFNAYRQTQSRKVEKAMTSAVYVASFIGHEPGKALFVGLYSVGTSRPLTGSEYWQVPACIEMKEKYGMKGFTEDNDRSTILWFDLAPTDFYVSWKGKLIVKWPPPELAWWRRADGNIMPVLAILQDSAPDPPMPNWHEIVLAWEELEALSASWESKLAQWRAIYYIFDASDGKGYVGSAFGVDNLLGRWRDYADSGHGGNLPIAARR
jgi:hypothetical protein